MPEVEARPEGILEVLESERIRRTVWCGSGGMDGDASRRRGIVPFGAPVGVGEEPVKF